MILEKKRFKGKSFHIPQANFLPCGLTSLAVFLTLVFLLPGCGGAFGKEKTLEKDGLTLTYRSVNRIYSDIDNAPLQHPVKISQDMIHTHLVSLWYGKTSSPDKRRPVFAPADANKMSRLLAKALNRARQDRYIHFEFDTAKGQTTGEVFASAGKIHWVFVAINGVDYSNDPLGIRKSTWKLSPQKGQQYYYMKTNFGKRARENWIVADFRLPKPGQVPPQAEEKTLALPGFAPASDRADGKRKLLQFLKHLHEKGLIGQEEYERERKELMGEK